MKVIILAGGQGSRLWPLSKTSYPKQFLNFIDGKSLLQSTIERFDIDCIDEILIITNKKYELLVLHEATQSEKCTVLTEPFSKNTAPAITYAFKYFKEKGVLDETPILIAPADHYLFPNEVLYEGIKRALSSLKKGKINIFGISPTRSETGYGYILRSQEISQGIFKVIKFVEKPSLKLANEYFLSGKYLWNSGMFLLTPKTFWKELQLHAPDIYQNAHKEKHFHNMPHRSIDFAVMEKSENIVVCPLSLRWSDIGSWDSVYDLLDKDENFNVKMGNVISYDTKNSLVLGKKKLISTMGIRNMVIVETDEAIFIAKRGKLQGMKNLIDLIKKKVVSLKAKS